MKRRVWLLKVSIFRMFRPCFIEKKTYGHFLHFTLKFTRKITDYCNTGLDGLRFFYIPVSLPFSLQVFDSIYPLEEISLVQRIQNQLIKFLQHILARIHNSFFCPLFADVNTQSWNFSFWPNIISSQNEQLMRNCVFYTYIKY